MSFVPITATGGTISTVVIDGDAYRLHTFTSTGNTNFVVTDLGDDANIEFLLVAGGGGGGGASNDRSEAGFGGQVITSSGSVSIGTYTVTVGAGGTGVFWAGSAGAGANSSISGTGISSSSQGGKGGDSRACCPSQVVAGQAGFIGGPTTTNFTGSSVTYGSNGPTSALNAAGTNGAPNTGNGGSDNWNQGNGRGGDGGSGIVIVKYLLEPATSFDDSEVSEIIENGVRYRVHQFKKVGTSSFVVQSPTLNIEYLIVAGGGAGGASFNNFASGGGGGGGGVLAGTLTANTGIYEITVGAGGLGATGVADSNPGANTSAFELTAIGGGRGGRWLAAGNPSNAGSGGSGGGGANASGLFDGGAGTTGQGNAGGDGVAYTANASSGGGGGGGKSTAGSPATASSGGLGGEGLLSTITGQALVYGSGGGGGHGLIAGAGGTRAGSGGSGNANGFSAQPNSGGGGGGAGNNNGGSFTSGNGGSGIVIIRYVIDDQPLPGNTLYTKTLASVNTFKPITATGGTVTDITVGSDTYRVHTFANTGNTDFIVTDPGTTGLVECLIVGGGGGGGRFYGGGGGAGGVLESTFKVTNQTYTVSVGAGGIGADAPNRGQNGQNSSVFDLVAFGGGGGGGNSQTGNPGGSGGGGSTNLGAGGTGVTDQGNNGAGGLPTTASGGGGGAGLPAYAQNGGIGKISAITGTATYYGGGGGGPILNNVTVTALGGLGGGGGGASGVVAENGTNGLGGGGAGWTGTGTSGGTGGSGVVFIRYPLTNRTVKVQSPSYISSKGSPIQVNYFRTDERSQWSAPVGLIGTPVRPAGLSITPKKRNSLIVMTWMLNGEVHWDTVWDIYVQNAVVSMSQFEGYNRQVVPRQRWAGYVSGFYDAQGNTDSTMESFFIQYSMIAPTTETYYFYPAIRSSTATAYTFSLNRCAGALGQDSYENAITTGMIMEIPQ